MKGKMQMKKRLLSVVLCAVMLLSLMPAMAFAASVSDVETDGTYLYTPITDNEGHAVQSWTSGGSYYPSEDIYANVDGEYVKVKLGKNDVYKIVTDSNDDPITSWTAESVDQLYQNNTRQDPDIYREYNGGFEKVKTKKEPYYKNAGEIPASYFANPEYGSQWNYHTNNPWMEDHGHKYYYAPDIGSIQSREPSWHQVHANSVGVNRGQGGLKFIDIWYYVNEDDHTDITYDSDLTSYSSQYKNALRDGLIKRIPKVGTDSWGIGIDLGHGDYEAKIGYVIQSTVNYTGGLLYERIDTNNTPNRLYGETSEEVLAWPLTKESNTDPIRSSTWENHNLYYNEGNGVISLKDEDNNPLGSVEESNIYGTLLYSGKLYTRSKLGDLGGKKTLEGNPADGYTLTIDSWSNGDYQKFVQNQSESGGEEIVKVSPKTPLDIVLVMDQSSSMATKDMGEAVPVAQGSTFSPTTISNGSYFCKVDGKYYPVYQEEGPLYSKSNAPMANWMYGWGHDGISIGINGAPVFYNVSTDHYILDDSGEMHRIFVITAGLDLHYGLYPYVYTDPNDAYTKKSQWKTNTYWIAIFDPWTAKKLRKDSKWNTLTDEGAEESRVSFINTNGKMIGSSDADGNSAKLAYSWITNASRIKNVYKRTSDGYNKLYYVDDNGNKHYVSNTRNFKNDDYTIQNTDDNQLYIFSGEKTRVEALQDAAKEFVKAVKEDEAADANGLNAVEHRIAVAGFAGNKVPANNTGTRALGSNGKRDYVNTGLFQGSTFTNYETLAPSLNTRAAQRYINKHYYTDTDAQDAVRFDGDEWYHVFDEYSSSITNNTTFYEPTYSSTLLNSGKYSDAFRDAKSSDVSDAIDSLAAWGGTYTSYGVAMANQIFAANDVRTENIITSTASTDNTTPVQSKRIVVIFTDGEPGASGYESAIANEALAGSAQSKSEYDADVYTIGLYKGNVSDQITDFMKQLSSEYSAKLTEVYSGSEYALADNYNLNGSDTYYYIKDGKVYSATAARYGESSLGWWEYNASEGSYTLLNVKGKNAGSGTDYLYSRPNGTGATYGEDANKTATYYSADGNPVKYEYRWYDADRSIVNPKTSNSDSDSSHVQFYQIAEQERNSDGKTYYMNASDPDSLKNAFKAMAASITEIHENTESELEPGIKGTATNYDKTNSFVRDVISDDFDLSNGYTITVQKITGADISEDGTVTGGTAETLVSGNGPSGSSGDYAYTVTGKTIDVTGFDFGAAYKENAVLRVIVEGLKPTIRKGIAVSNTSESGIYEKDGNKDKMVYEYNHPSTSIGPYKVTWMNSNIALETDSDVGYGDHPQYDGETPVKEATADYVYNFIGWSENPDAETGELDTNQLTVTKDTTYYAIFDPIAVEDYTVIWHDSDAEGTVLHTDNNVKTGTSPTYTDITHPVTVGENQYFAGWSLEKGNAEKMYFGNETVEQLAGDGNVVHLYAIVKTKSTITPHTVMVEYGTRNIIDDGVYDYSVATKTVTKGANIGSVPMENAGKFDLQINRSEPSGTFAFVPQMIENDEDVVDFTPLSDVSMAYYYKDSDYSDVHQVSVIPASSVYFDDSLTEVSTEKATDNTFNYKAAIQGDVNVNDADAMEKGEVRTFRFSGSRVDVYCTTDGTANSVIAVLYKIGTDGTRTKVSSKVVNNKFVNGTFYNTPTVSFDGLDNTNVYELDIMGNTSSVKYRFDGIRVYNPTVSDEVAEKQNALGEGNVLYKKVREILITDRTTFDNLEDGIAAAIFVDKNGFNGESTFQEYKDLGPKNEVYIQPGQGIGFRIANWDVIKDDAKIAIGLSSQNGTGKVLFTSNNGVVPTDIKTATDMYYDVTPNENGLVVIKNNSSGTELIAITNIKVYGAPDITWGEEPESGEIVEPDADPNHRTVSFAMNRPMMARYLASFDSLPEVEEPGDDPTVEPGDDPTVEPGDDPTVEPGDDPAVEPGDDPTVEPGDDPTVEPGDDPTVEPGDDPTVTPEPSQPQNGIIGVIQGMVKSIMNTVSKLFKSIFRW